MTEPRTPAPMPPAPRDGDLGVAAFLEARARADDARLRTAFADLGERVRVDVRPPGARATLEQADRVRTGRRGGVLLAAAAAAVVAVGGGWAVLGPGRTGPAASPGPVVTAPTPVVPASTSADPSRSARPTTTTQAPPVATTSPGTQETGTRPTRRRTTTPADDGSPAPSGTGGQTGQKGQTAPAGPRTTVTLFLLSDDGIACPDPVAVTRTIPGTGDPASVLRALLAGATDAERAAGYRSAFGPDVQATVSDDGRTVDLLDTAAFDDVDAICRDDAVSEPIERTADALDVNVEILLRGSRLDYLLWD